MTFRARVCLSSGICLAGLIAALHVPESSAAHDRTYVVQAGDTLSAIGFRLHSTQRELARLNGIADPSHLQVGQVLIVPEGSAAWRGTGWSDRDLHGSPAPATTDQVPSTVDQPQTTVYGTRTTTYSAVGIGANYVVQPGDTLGALSARFGVPMNALSSANGIDRPEFLRAGQRLLIPARTTVAGSNTLPAVAVSPAPAVSTPLSTAATTIPGSSDMPSASLSGATASRAEVGALLASAAQTYNVDPALVKAVAWQESGWQMVTASDGGIGVMQLMPATAAWVGPALLGRAINPANLTDNIQAGVALLASYVHQYGDVRTALIAYNAGPLAITRGIGSGTAQYIANVLSLRASFAQ